jgi:glycerol-3-phosphate dehydrogenase
VSGAETGIADLLIVGGGINGTGIARDAAGRGLKVIVAERSDLASATSSASTKLIHGGLRYLEYYEFRLVREALSEREVLLKAAPHIIWPLRFVLPHDRSLRPAWIIRIGLFLYDHLGGRKLLPASKRVSLARPPYSSGLKPGIHEIGFEYSDCWVNDARMVVLNAMDARERGAEILPRTSCTSARRENGIWVAELQTIDGRRRTVRAKGLVNATGPWAGEFVSRQLGINEAATLRLVKGSHIIIDRLYEGDHAFILQNSDRRIVFTIPYEGKFTLVGTTDVPYQGDPAKVAISGDETRYLCDLVNRYFAKTITPDDVVWNYSGVRPLFDEGGSESASAVSRDYVLELEDEEGKAPLLNVFGGKITTFRRLSEHALQKLKPFFPEARGDWTKGAPMPGGDIANADFESFAAEQIRRYSWLTPAHVRRLCRAYGTRIGRVIGDARAVGDLGRHFGGDLYEAEVRYLRDQEWAAAAEDVLWRRSKLGLHVPKGTAEALRAWFAEAGVNPETVSTS